MAAESYGSRRAEDGIGNAEIVRMIAALNDQIRAGFDNTDKRFDEMSRRIELTVTKEVFELAERDKERRMGQLELETVRLSNMLEAANERISVTQTQAAEKSTANFKWIMASFIFPIAVAIVIYVVLHIK